MGYIFEELIRRFNEASNEEAGDHFTPREVIRLMVNLLFLRDGDVLTTKGIGKTLYDPAGRTGGCSRWPRSTSANSTPTGASRSSARTTTPRPTPSVAPT